MPSGTTATSIAVTKIAGYASAVAFFESVNMPGRMIVMLSFLMLIDFSTGLGKAWKVNDPITSHKITEGVMKKLFMILIVCAIAALLFGMGIDYGPAMNFLIPILLMAEFYSIVQNVYAFRTGEILPEYDVVSMLIKKIGEWVVSVLRTSISKSGDIVSAVIGKK